MKPALLVRSYLSELTHVHTKVSNHPGHIESNLTVSSIMRALRRSRLMTSDKGIISHVIITEHVSDSAAPHAVTHVSWRGLRLLSQLVTPHRESIRYGMEVSLLPDGTIDAGIGLVTYRPIVIASRHSLPTEIQNSAEAVTNMSIEACRNPLVTVLGHPARGFEGMAVDWRAIFREAAKTDTAIEININTYPNQSEDGRLTFWKAWLKLLAKSKARVTLGSDIHTRQQLALFITSTKQMRRGKTPNTIWYHALHAIDEAGITPDRLMLLTEKNA
jgi:histidinol phosphatase-like PHP family hydrolase